MRFVSTDDAALPVILALDLGSSSIRALLIDAEGRQIEDSETQIEHALTASTDGGSHGDAAAMFEIVCACVDGVLRDAGTIAERIGAVATSCFWHSLLALDASGEPDSPVLMWSDKRSGGDVPGLIARIPPEALHQRTGCRPHSSYWPAKLLWFRRTHPDTWRRAARWVSFCDYVTLKLTGELVTSLSMASGTGLLDIGGNVWDETVLGITDVGMSDLPALVDRADALPALNWEFGKRWPALAGIPWYPAIGDGAAANVGAGCIGTDRIAITVGTSAAMRMVANGAGDAQADGQAIPPRIWNYRLDRDLRVVGGALSNAGNVAGWLAGLMADGEFDVLADKAAAMTPDGHGLTVLPFLAGERSPSWNDDATGTFSGIRLSTTPADLFRATLEATAYRLAAIYDDLVPLVDPVHEIHINGAAALRSPLWIQVIADTLGHPVLAAAEDTEGSARGAALCALQALGARPELRGPVDDVSDVYDPDPARHAAYLSARGRQRELEAALSDFQHHHHPIADQGA